MDRRRFDTILLLFLLIGAVAASTVLFYRHRAEAQNRTVDLTVDYAQVVQLAAAAGVGLETALTELKAAGATSVALTEESVSDLVSAGAARVEQARLPGAPRAVTLLQFSDAASMDRVEASLQARLRFPRTANTAERVMLRAPGREGVIYPVSWDVLRALDIGLSPEERARVVASGLGIVGRVGNFTGASPEVIRWVIGALKRDGARVVVFTGDEVLGHRAGIKETAAALDAQGLLYGSVEMGKQRGDEVLSQALDARIVRVHAVQAAEMARLTPPVAIERYVRAVRERNIRLAYLRLFTAVADDPLAENLNFVRGTAAELRERGFQTGPAVPFQAVLPPMGPLGRLLPACVALMVVAGGLMLWATLAPFPRRAQVTAALLLGAVAVALAFASPGLGRRLLALAGAILFPTLAFTLWPLRGPGPASVARGWLLRFALMSAVSLLGGLAVVGLLSDRAALVKVSEFSGIKVAQALPLLALAAIVVGDVWASAATWEAHRRRVEERFATFLLEPLRLWQVLVALVALIALVLMLLRTGNDPGVSVSSLELSFRSLLDSVLVRPRTKEFLMGHPALIVALFLWATGRGRLFVLPLLLVGMVGQAGMVNSFCHLHTPIALTLARTWNGLWLGALIGLVVAWIVSGLGRKRSLPQRHEEVTKSTKKDLIAGRTLGLFVFFVTSLCLCGEMIG
jgi:hypothetical protein